MVVKETPNSIEDQARIPKEAKKILHELASNWSDVADNRALLVLPLKGAMTNEVYQVKWPTEGRSRKVLVRIYGEGVDVFFDREDEIRTFECMSRHGQGPRLLGRFPNGRVEEFINARTLSAADLRDPETSALIALKLREFHELDVPGPKNVLLWERLRNWLKAARMIYSRVVNELDSIHFSIKMASKLVKKIGRQVATDRCIMAMLFLIVAGVVAITIVKIVNPHNKDIADIPGLAPPAQANRRLLWDLSEA